MFKLACLSFSVTKLVRAFEIEVISKLGYELDECRSVQDLELLEKTHPKP